MKKLVTSRVLWTALLLWSLFLPLKMLLPPEQLFDLVNGLALLVSIAVLTGYFTGILAGLRSRPPTGAHLLVLGIACTWFAQGARTLWSWAYRYSGRPDDWQNHWLLAFLIWMVFWGGVLHLSAKDAIGGKIPSRYYIRMGIIVACAVGLMLLLANYFTYPGASLVPSYNDQYMDQVPGPKPGRVPGKPLWP